MSTWLSYLLGPSGGTYTIPTAKLEETLSALLKTINPTVEGPSRHRFSGYGLCQRRGNRETPKNPFCQYKRRGKNPSGLRSFKI